MTDIINVYDNNQRPLQAGDNGPAPALIATPVPDEQRVGFWPQHFGNIPQWITL